jgi:flagellar motor switch protein FliN/FliY
MTEASAPAQQPGPAEFPQIWGGSFSQVVGQITGAAMPCVVRTEAPADLPPAGESDLWAMVTSSGALRGEMALRLTGATVLRLAQIFMSEPANAEAPLTDDHREAVIELLRQVSGVVSTTAKARWGEIQLRVERNPAAPSWPPASTFWLQAGEAGPTNMGVELGLSAALVAELRAEKGEAVKAGMAPAAAAPTAADVSPLVGAAVPSADPAQGTGAMDMLMDVHLAMTLRFGARILLLREVLELNPGAVVELDRKVQEPVDLLLDGRLVARGELVVIDGNYGLRVTDVSPLGGPARTA